ncbi:hypothetical protein TRAPUB_1345 [Trametes pubescens]|uniref:DUF6534 domain-containing protein n=1 Tax=Trametes pubescens TaxID=154538 RepID=A0A1M2VJP3_TRAPU|nr:hypothetical protein TRAPUB_1345 [Trametes pubescens]
MKAGDFDSLKVSLYLNFASAVLADAAVAVTLLCLLRGTKTGNPRRDSAVGRLILYTVNTGLLTAADAAVALLTYGIMPRNFVFFAPYMILSHFYTNALFASLNARTLGGFGEQTVSVNFSMSTVNSPPRFTGTSGGGPGSPQVSVSLLCSKSHFVTRADAAATQLGIPIQTFKEESQSDNEDMK